MKKKLYIHKNRWLYWVRVGVILIEHHRNPFQLRNKQAFGAALFLHLPFERFLHDYIDWYSIFRHVYNYPVQLISFECCSPRCKMPLYGAAHHMHTSFHRGTDKKFCRILSERTPSLRRDMAMHFKGDIWGVAGMIGRKTMSIIIVRLKTCLSTATTLWFTLCIKWTVVINIKQFFPEKNIIIVIAVCVCGVHAHSFTANSPIQFSLLAEKVWNCNTNICWTLCSCRLPQLNEIGIRN